MQRRPSTNPLKTPSTLLTNCTLESSIFSHHHGVLLHFWQLAGGWRKPDFVAFWGIWNSRQGRFQATKQWCWTSRWEGPGLWTLGGVAPAHPPPPRAWPTAKGCSSRRTEGHGIGCNFITFPFLPGPDLSSPAALQVLFLGWGEGDAGEGVRGCSPQLAAQRFKVSESLSQETRPKTTGYMYWLDESQLILWSNRSPKHKYIMAMSPETFAGRYAKY